MKVTRKEQVAELIEALAALREAELDTEAAEGLVARRRAEGRLSKAREAADRLLLGYLGSGYMESRARRVR